MEGTAPDNLEAVIKIRKHGGKHVTLLMAMFKLMHVRQGSKSVTEFAREVHDLAERCQYDTKPYDKNRAMKDAFTFGTSDDKLCQEALVKDFTYAQVMQAALGYEQSRRASGSIKQTSGEEVRQVTYTQDDVDAIVARVMSGKYSSRSNTVPPKPDSKQGNNKCRNCPPHYKPHPPGKYPANGKMRVVCKGHNHFAGSPTCPVSRIRSRP